MAVRPDMHSIQIRGGLNRVEILVVLTMIGILVGILLPAIKAVRPYQPPTIPDREPGEAYRVYLPNGLSIVRPPYWEVVMGMAPDGSAGCSSLTRRSATDRVRPSESPGARRPRNEGRETSMRFSRADRPG